MMKIAPRMYLPTKDETNITDQLADMGNWWKMDFGLDILPTAWRELFEVCGSDSGKPM